MRCAVADPSFQEPYARRLAANAKAQDVIEAAVGTAIVAFLAFGRIGAPAFATIVEQRIGGLLVKGDPFFNSRRTRLVRIFSRLGWGLNSGDPLDLRATRILH